MKYSVGDRVRVIAWCPPGTTVMEQTCGQAGVVDRIRVDDPNEGADGGYRVVLDVSGMRLWFRACDIVPIDSACTCDNTVRHTPIGACPVHEHPDFDPVTETAASLLALVQEMEHGGETEFQKRVREEYSPHE